MSFTDCLKLIFCLCLSVFLAACGGSSNGENNQTQPPITENRTLVNAFVQSSNGALLKGVTVSILDQKAITNENGIAQLNVNVPKGSDEIVVKYEEEGFITQSVLVKVDELKNVTGILLAAKEIVPVEEIEKAQVIKASSLGATITIPENAFVKESGGFAQGKVNVQFTPWDIRSDDLNAMPANGEALDEQGNRAQLISAGMITATFIDAVTGEKLQLIEGKKADIQMNLSLKSINNQEMKVGTEIPMWHFDETKGLWIEDGTGTVIASANSETGLAVHATVKHFSTWNWDLKLDNGGSVYLQCTMENKAIPCSIIAKVKLDDGSSFTRSTYVSSEGTSAYNMPSNATIEWIGTSLDGKNSGTVISGTNGAVIIQFKERKTINYVQCVLPNGQATTCSLKINDQLDLNITEDGATISTDENVQQLSWAARSTMILENNQWVRYSGTTTSEVRGNVSIQLSQREVIYTFDEGMSFYAVCSSDDGTPESSDTTQNLGKNWEVKSSLIGQPCEITINVHLGDQIGAKEFKYSAVYGKPFKIELPKEYSGFDAEGKGVIQGISFTSLLQNEQGRKYYGYAYLLQSLTNNETVVMNLYTYCENDLEDDCMVLG